MSCMCVCACVSGSLSLSLCASLGALKRSLCCSGAALGKPLSDPANPSHTRRCHSQHNAAPTAVLHSPHRHQVVLHMYQPTVLNSLVLETLPMAALNNLRPQHISRLCHAFRIGWSSFLKQNGGNQSTTTTTTFSSTLGERMQQHACVCAKAKQTQNQANTKT